MSEFLLAVGTALWLGILTSISPCPMTTNIAAISFLSKKALHVREVLWAGFAYTFGRMLVYMLLGVLITQSLLGVPAVAHFLQGNMNKVFGPLMVVVGLFLLDILKFRIPGINISSEGQDHLASTGSFGALGLGALFAVSFCPVSAALFFGSLIPLALKSKGGVLLPLFYGLGTGLPVLFFAVVIALGVRSLERWLHNLKRLEMCTRWMTGVIFILVGLYYIWMHFLA